MTMASDPDKLELLTAYLDGELSEAKRREVEGWLAQDRSAQSLLADLGRTARLVSALPREQAPRDLSGRITVRLEREALLGNSPPAPRTSSSRSRWLGWMALAASIALVITAGWLFWPQSSFTSHSEVIVVAENEPPRTPMRAQNAQAAKSLDGRLAARPAMPAEAAPARDRSISPSAIGARRIVVEADPGTCRRIEAEVRAFARARQISARDQSAGADAKMIELAAPDLHVAELTSLLAQIGVPAGAKIVTPTQEAGGSVQFEDLGTRIPTDPSAWREEKREYADEPRTDAATAAAAPSEETRAQKSAEPPGSASRPSDPTQKDELGGELRTLIVEFRHRAELKAGDQPAGAAGGATSSAPTSREAGGG